MSTWTNWIDQVLEVYFLPKSILSKPKQTRRQQGVLKFDEG